MTTDTDLALDPVHPWEAPELAEEFSKESFEQAGEAFNAFDKTIAGLHETNQSWLKGEISGDVADQLRQQSRLSARMGGVEDSQMARNLQARDFGTTSMQIQQQGMQQEGAIAGLQQASAQMREQRSQFMQQMLEQSRQFGASLEQDALRTQLAHRELMLKQDAFNAEQNMRIIEMITNATMAQTGQQVQAAIGKVKDSGILGTFNKLQEFLGEFLPK